MKRIVTLLVLSALVMTLSACQNLSEDYRLEVQEFAMIVEDGDLSALNEYPNLQYVDLRGSTCYDTILDYAQAHPSITVRYNVQVGQKRVNQDDAELALSHYDFEYDLLLENLKYLPKIQAVHFKETELTADQVQTLRSTYPNIAFSYTVDVHNQEIPHDATSLNLSTLGPEGVDEVVAALRMLPELQEIELMGLYGSCPLSTSDVKKLIDAAPSAKIHYEFTLFGQKVSTLDEQLVFDTVQIGNEGVGEIRAALDIMTQCTYAKFDSCGIDDETMAALRADYPQRNVVWRVFVEKYSLLTDEEMIRMNSKLNNENVAPLKYCTEIKYVDISNNKDISDISFLGSMPKLEAVVLTLTKTEDLSPLANCPNLTWLELTACSHITDLSPLSGLQNLKYLNVAATKVSDVSSLDNLQLERFNCVEARVSKAAQESFKAKHPSCITVSTGSTRGNGWRYDDDKGTVFSYYAELQQIFRYNEKNYFGNRK